MPPAAMTKIYNPEPYMMTDVIQSYIKLKPY